MMPWPDRHKARGFTMMELLITVVVAAILMSFAVPSFQSAIQESRQKNSVFTLVGGLTYARSEAIKRSSRVSVCARSTNSTCGTNWDKGWIVFVDNGPNPGVIDATETVLKVTSSLPTGLKITNSAVVHGASDAIQRTYVRFGPRGLSNWRGSGTFTVCDERGTSSARAVNLSMSGDVRSARADGSGTIHDMFGNAISCDTGTST